MILQGSLYILRIVSLHKSSYTTLLDITLNRLKLNRCLLYDFMKIIVVVLFSLIVIGIGGVLAIVWWDQCSPRAIRGEWNIQNYKRIRKGMTRNQLVSILGKPAYRSGPSRQWQRDSVYYYNTHPVTSSSSIHVHFDSTARVSYVFADI